MELPIDLIVDIIDRADLSIDTRIDLRKTLGLRWKKMEVDLDFHKRLSNIWARRTRNFAKYLQQQQENSFRWSTTLDMTAPIKVDTDVYLEISVTDFGGGNVEMCIKTTRIFETPIWTIRISTHTCDVHTGN